MNHENIEWAEDRSELARRFVSLIRAGMLDDVEVMAAATIASDFHVEQKWDDEFTKVRVNDKTWDFSDVGMWSKANPHPVRRCWVSSLTADRLIVEHGGVRFRVSRPDRYSYPGIEVIE